MDKLITISTFCNYDTDYSMVAAMVERANRWEDCTDVMIYVDKPESDGFKQYQMNLLDMNKTRIITIGCVKRPNSDEIEFHS